MRSEDNKKKVIPKKRGLKERDIWLGDDLEGEAR